MKQEISKTIDVADRRSAWSRGVIVYAQELLDSLSETELRECALLGGGDGWSTIKNAMLNGAKDWKEYSWGGCSLIYDADIAERLCSPSELKRTRNGARKPNAREEWLDTQARALYQASRLVWRATEAVHKSHSGM